ncbi:MAG: hypothetical protein ACE5KM_21220 [Planctomycetaceae bacterium]
MRSIKRIAEWYFGVPDARPGQDTQWAFSHDWPWPTWVPDWLMLLGVPLLVAAIALVYWRDARSAPLRIKLALSVLRLSEIGLLVLFLSNVTLSVDGTELPVVVVLVDRSASMALDDHYANKDVARAVRDLLKETGQEKPTRINLAKGLLTREEGRFLKELQDYHRLHVYEFAGDARRFDKGEFLNADDVERILPVLKTRLQADGELTNHRAALKQVLEDLSGSPPSAIILLTDGITTSGPHDTLSQAAGLAARQSVPVYVVALGSADPARDLELSNLRVPEVAFVDDPISFNAELRGFGVSAKRATVKLFRKGRVAPLETKSVAIPAGGRKAVVEVPHTPSEPGDFEYRLEVRPLPQEANTANNQQTARVHVKRERLKVLLADALPRREFRYLKHLLEREKTVELHTILQEGDPAYSAEDETAKPLKGRFPLDRKALSTYDTVILGDVDVSSLPREVLRNLVEFVKEGGSLIFIAGIYHNPVTYFSTPLKALLPFNVGDVKPPPDDETAEIGFRPVLTGAGRGNPMLRLSGSGETNDKVRKQLPPLLWLLEIQDLKPAAQVLLEHPERSTRPRGRDARRRRLPVVILQRVGLGKVLFHATDDLWRWRRLVGDLYYGRYWMQVLRALYYSKRLGKTRAAELESDRRQYVQGQTVRLSLRFFDAERVPEDDDGVIVVVERNGVVVNRFRLRRVPHRPSLFSLEIPRIVEGAYRVTVQIPDFPKGAPDASFVVAPPQRELQVRTADERELKAIARRTDGKVVTIAEASSLPGRIPRGRPTPLNDPQSIPLWNRWELMLLFAGLLLAEWLLRKRIRLI